MRLPLILAQCTHCGREQSYRMPARFIAHTPCTSCFHPMRVKPADDPAQLALFPIDPPIKTRENRAGAPI